MKKTIRSFPTCSKCGTRFEGPDHSGYGYFSDRTHKGENVHYRGNDLCGACIGGTVVVRKFVKTPVITYKWVLK